jgi:hypothetical protein
MTGYAQIPQEKQIISADKLNKLNLRPTYFIFSQIWLRFMLYALRPTFMKSTPGFLLEHVIFKLFDMLFICIVLIPSIRDACLDSPLPYFLSNLWTARYVFQLAKLELSPSLYPLQFLMIKFVYFMIILQLQLRNHVKVNKKYGYSQT